MRKRGFTLVEILIVIVIIGILIGALVPRMQSAQGRARDVARKNDLSQLQSAIVTSYNDKGKWPGLDDCEDGEDGEKENCGATNGIDIKVIGKQLTSAGMNSIPKDPTSSSEVTGLGDKGGAGEYRYMIVKSNGTSNGGFVLMAKTEVEGGSNRVYCEAGEGTDEVGKITNDKDTKDLKLCTSLSEDTKCEIPTDGGACTYTKTSELRYILVN